MMVLSLWAMVMTVHSLNWSRMVACMRSSVCMSTAAVASSNTRILVFLNSARARQVSWRCPTLSEKSARKKNYCETSASLKVHLAEKMWNSCSTNVCSAATRKLTALLRCLFTTVWHKKETLPNGIAWAYLSGAILPSKAKPARVVAKQHRLGLETALFGERAAGP